MHGIVRGNTLREAAQERTRVHSAAGSDGIPILQGIIGIDVWSSLGRKGKTDTIPP